MLFRSGLYAAWTDGTFHVGHHLPHPAALPLSPFRPRSHLDGVDFLTTQMFFDNDIHYNFLYRIREAGITVPVLPGIMPITSAAQMKRSQELSGTVFPRRFLAILDRFGSSPDAMKQAGIAYATDQIIDLLANGVNNIHIYSMNKPEIAVAIMNNLSEIIKC